MLRFLDLERVGAFLDRRELRIQVATVPPAGLHQRGARSTLPADGQARIEVGRLLARRVGGERRLRGGSLRHGPSLARPRRVDVAVARIGSYCGRRKAAARTRPVPGAVGCQPGLLHLHEHSAHHDGRRAPRRIHIRPDARPLRDGRFQRRTAATIDARSLLSHPYPTLRTHTTLAVIGSMLLVAGGSLPIPGRA